MGKILLPFRYPGGKYYALKLINPVIHSVEYDEYREPFFGGGAVFWGNKKVRYNWINDLYKDLYSTLLVIQDPQKREQLIEFFDGELEATREQYEKVKTMIPQNEIEEAYKFYYLNRTSFSGKMKSPSWGYRPKRSLPPYRWKERIVPCGEKLEDVQITNYDFETVICAPAQGKQVMLFVDPPYYLAKSDSHYVCDMSEEDHIRLATVLKNTSHKFVLTYDDCKEIRELYNWANIHDLQFFYRIDNSQHTDNQRKVGAELIITNFDWE